MTPGYIAVIFLCFGVGFLAFAAFIERRECKWASVASVAVKRAYLAEVAAHNLTREKLTNAVL